ncbi:MAG: SDR family oxidoreductase [Bacteroidia bacterium]
MKTRTRIKTILITGTSKGIGHKLAEYYLARGQRVIGCSRSETILEHPEYSHFQADVSQEKDVKDIFASLKREGTRLDVLINNAGIASMNHIATTPVETFRKIIETNLTGTFLFSREAARMMMKNKNGRIINFTSVASPLYLPGEAAYAASKAAIENFTVVSAKEFAPFGITVNAVGFTPFKTDLIKSVPEEKMNDLLEQQAIKRYARIEDITNITDFFISENSDFITAQVLFLGGIVK